MFHSMLIHPPNNSCLETAITDMSSSFFKQKNISGTQDAHSTPRDTSIMALFADVMEGSTNMRVDPRSCVPLTSVRQISRSGVMRLKAIFKRF